MLQKSILVLVCMTYLFFSAHRKKDEKFVYQSIHHTKADTMISKGELLVKEGDLIVRLNQDPVSQFIMAFNRKDRSYSHAGIVVFENNEPFVLHIIYDEEKSGGYIRKEPMAKFCDPRKNMTFGLFRYTLSNDEVVALMNILQQWRKQGVSFDTGFDLRTNDRMYCSEMIAKALAISSNNRVKIKTTLPEKWEARLFSIHTGLPFEFTKNNPVIAIDDLYNVAGCTRIFEARF